MFKPHDGSLWGYHILKSSIDNLLAYTKGRSQEEDKEKEDENEVDLAKTLWLVLRKKEAINDTLRHFFAQYQTFNLKVKDIVKFGRVNFRIAALHSKRLNPDIIGEDIFKSKRI